MSMCSSKFLLIWFFSTICRYLKW